MKTCTVPLALIIYHRPAHAQKLMTAVAKVQPTTIWIIADGPKNPEDKKPVDQTRQTVERSITWKCQIHKIYAPANLGLKSRVITGLQKVFAAENRAIILEEDCLPSSSFFGFCQELLERYKNESSVLSISGGNYLFGQGKPVVDSYYFSHYFSAWGWATWARAWKHYDPDLQYIPGYNLQNLKSQISNLWANWYWQTMIKKIKSGKVNDTWDYQWTIAHLWYGGLSIIPAKNLVKNIGFGRGASHTKFKHRLADLQMNRLNFPIFHPKHISPRADLDAIIEKHTYLSGRSILGLLLR